MNKSTSFNNSLNNSHHKINKKHTTIYNKCQQPIRKISADKFKISKKPEKKKIVLNIMEK